MLNIAAYYFDCNYTKNSLQRCSSNYSISHSPRFQGENDTANMKKASSGDFASIYFSDSREKVQEISKKMEHILDSVEVKVVAPSNYYFLLVCLIM